MTWRSDARHSLRQAQSTTVRGAELTSTEAFDVLAIGRSGVDIYPLQIGVGLEDVETFGKFLGGSAANVAVAAARLGNRTALITGVGDDPFGRFVRAELRRPRRRRPRTSPRTASTRRRSRSARSSRRTTSRCTSTASPSRPTCRSSADEIDLDAVRGARLYWSTVTGLSEEPSRSAHFAAWEARGRAPLTVLDLDYRPMFWATPAAATEQVQRALQHVTRRRRQPRGVRDRGRRDRPAPGGRRAARPRRGAGHRQAGPARRARQDPSTARRGAAQRRSTSSTASAPATRFGGSLIHGLLHGWPLEKTLRFANAAGAIVASRLECSTAMPTSRRGRRSSPNRPPWTAVNV